MRKPKTVPIREDHLEWLLHNSLDGPSCAHCPADVKWADDCVGNTRPSLSECIAACRAKVRRAIIKAGREAANGNDAMAEAPQ